MKKRWIFLLTGIGILLQASADEGMWVPMFIQRNEADMKRIGMKISAEDIYSINHSSLKDAVVRFGGGCTGEYVSNRGLLFTNHHCGYGEIVRHSTVESNYLTNGFWARTIEEELPCPGLAVTSLVRMKDVTAEVLAGIEDQMPEDQRNQIIKENISHISKKAVEGTHYTAEILPFYYGNQYFLYINEVFKDIRLTGAPPSNIGKFGGDTDNWMWPRHTGDFSIFRVYADIDNKPAEYSKNNVPYQPKKHLSISLKGVEEGDFTLVFGYPGRTSQYLTAEAVDLIANTYNPARIALRDKRLEIYNAAMNVSDAQRLRYANIVAGIANGWKKMIGESRGIIRLNAVEKKKEYERNFQNWVNQNADRKAVYGDLLSNFENIYRQLSEYELAWLYYNEAFLSSDVMKTAGMIASLMKECHDLHISDTAFNKKAKEVYNKLQEQYKNNNTAHQQVDKVIFTETLRIYYTKLAKELHPEAMDMIEKKYQGSVDLFAKDLFDKSIFISGERLLKEFNVFDCKRTKGITGDIAYQFYNTVTSSLEKKYPKEKIKKLNEELNQLYRLYVRAMMEIQPDRRFFPDANFTLRAAYGKIEGYSPLDAVSYLPFSTIEGIMQKENPMIYDYVVEPKLKELYQKKDYGSYQNQAGEIPVAFIASNHTTGGNSGSPVLNADGELVGINFDRCWEGTMSDLMYDPEQCRNIAVDIRYVLFIIDKFAGASNLIREITLTD